MFQVTRHFIALRVGGFAYMIMAIANVNSQYVTLTASMNGPVPPNGLSGTDFGSTSITNPVASILSAPFQFANQVCSLASGLFKPPQTQQNLGFDSVGSLLSLGSSLLNKPQQQQQQTQQQTPSLQQQQQQLQPQQPFIQQQALPVQQQPTIQQLLQPQQPFIQQQALPVQQQPTIQQPLQPQQPFIQQQPVFSQPQQQAPQPQQQQQQQNPQIIQ